MLLQEEANGILLLLKKNLLENATEEEKEVSGKNIFERSRASQ